MLFRLSCKPHCSKCINTASSLAFAVNSVISCARATLLAFGKCFPILIPTTRCFGFMPYLIPSSFLLNSFSYLFIPPRLTMPQWSICPPIYFSDIPLSLHSVYFLHCQFQIAYFCSLLPPEQIPVWHWTHSASIHSAMVCAFSFYRATLCASTVFAVGPCLYVHLSVTLVYCIQMAKDIVKLLSPPTSPMILVFWPQAPIPSSKGNPFSRGTNTRGGKKFFFVIFYQNHCLSRKQYEIGSWLPWNVNRKSQAAAQFLSVPMTLSDPLSHCILTSRISQKRCVLGTKLL